MRRIALLSLTLLTSGLTGGCQYKTWWNPPLTSGYSPNTPISNSINMSRVRGEGVAVKPLTTEPGDIWPGPLPPARTLQDLERQTPLGARPAFPVPGSPLSRAGNPLLAPMPGAGVPKTEPGAGQPPPPDRRIIVPNGDGSSTIIHPDGRIETVPKPR